MKSEETSDVKNNENNSSSSETKSSKDFSSDEAKESEGDSDPKNDNPKKINETKPVKHSCEICNITVNSATQLAQVIRFLTSDSEL